MYRMLWTESADHTGFVENLYFTHATAQTTLQLAASGGYPSIWGIRR
jgi:hypothetical protein